MGSKLIHIHLPSLTPYLTASRVQSHLVSRFLASKPPATLPARNPHIITAEFEPVYTCGRREIGTVSAAQQDFLRAGGRATFAEAMRGGQTTFHGPGQLVAYPILDLRTHKLTPRDYVCLLEKSIIAVLAGYDVKAMTTENTGVWTSPDDKIAAVGVRMRRHITSHGVGVNVHTDLWWFDRIVACGLEGKRTTSLEKEGVRGVTVQEVGARFVDVVGRRLGVEVERMGDCEVQSLIGNLGDG